MSREHAKHSSPLSQTGLPSLCLAFALSMAGCGHAPPPKSEPSELLERVMPMFSSTTLNGTDIHTGGIDSPLVVKFFASDCKPCSRTLLAAQGVYAAMPEVVVIGVAEDEREAEARKTVSKLGVKFPVIVDTDSSIARSFQIEHPPMAFVADKQGRIRWVGGADLTEEVLVAAVESVED